MPRRVLLDDEPFYSHSTSKGYEVYGIDPAQGAVVVVRPDGYVGLIAPIEDAIDVGQYFSTFMKAS